MTALPPELDAFVYGASIADGVEEDIVGTCEFVAACAYAAGWRAGAEAMRNKVLEGKHPALFRSYMDMWPIPDPPETVQP